MIFYYKKQKKKIYENKFTTKDKTVKTRNSVYQEKT